MKKIVGFALVTSMALSLSTPVARHFDGSGASARSNHKIKGEV